mmetsp:Transcript_3052/g.6704  ORF Transcript_3052/g.6704 Transcript_3052/m.6704 type:complete len:1021 (-) Transcript_3052:92-3154(-)
MVPLTTACIKKIISDTMASVGRNTNNAGSSLQTRKRRRRILTRGSLYRKPICIACAIISFFVATNYCSWAFAPPNTARITTQNLSRKTQQQILQATRQPKSAQQSQKTKNKKSNAATKHKKKKKSSSPKKYETIADMMEAMKHNPNEFVSSSKGREVNANGRRIDGKKKPKRSRKRAERPKQKYVYASQRRALELLEKKQQPKKKTLIHTEEVDDYGSEDHYDEEDVSSMNPRQQQQLLQQQRQQKQMEFLRSLGLNPAAQAADPVGGDGPEEIPRIVGRVRVDGIADDEEEEDTDEGDGGSNSGVTSNSFAYVMYKPVGWSILGEKKKNKNKHRNKDSGESAASASAVAEDGTRAKDSADNESTTTTNNKGNKRVKAYDVETDDFTYVEYNEADVLAVLTPEERDQLIKEGGLNLDDDLAEAVKGAISRTEYDDGDDEEEEEGLLDGTKKKKKKKKTNNTNPAAAAATTTAARPRAKANISTPPRPSLVTWLKTLKSSEGTPIKGGKHWVALAGATEIDDSGLVLLVPRDRVDAVHVDRCGYVAVVGNGKKLVSRSKLFKSAAASGGGGGGGTEMADDSAARIDILSRLKRGRDRDPVLTVGVTYPDGGLSTCAHAVSLVQDRLGDGVRGDALADPLDRRASRRLVHCASMAVSSLANLDDEPVVVVGSMMDGDEEDDEGEDDTALALPDDVANYANRRDSAAFFKGSFLGRQMGLASNGRTNAYREINGATDGFPGWIVDRYDKWLFVQQEEGPASVNRGPLPSLHDGYTAGVYYLPTKADRSVMGTTERIQPTLLEGKAAPPSVPVMENGIRYLINLGESFSTGIFLDQRLQRAWLAECCNEDTRVLNCFAHTGAFSIAAATSGAKTVSLDLDKKWLDRIRPQMEANGIKEWEGYHDCIYGDCFDWLARLAKRGEQFDIVILDPPSTSVGKKKKRWSVKNDMAELVALAAPLVKSDGLLFTTTNSATLTPEKFAKMCKKGLTDAGMPNARLERVSPMPSDFLSVGMQPVKNLVWRLP